MCSFGAVDVDALQRAGPAHACIWLRGWFRWPSAVDGRVLGWLFADLQYLSGVANLETALLQVVHRARLDGLPRLQRATLQRPQGWPLLVRLEPRLRNQAHQRPDGTVIRFVRLTRGRRARGCRCPALRLASRRSPGCGSLRWLGLLNLGCRLPCSSGATVGGSR